MLFIRYSLIYENKINKIYPLISHCIILLIKFVTIFIKKFKKFDTVNYLGYSVFLLFKRLKNFIFGIFSISSIYYPTNQYILIIMVIIRQDF